MNNQHPSRRFSPRLQGYDYAQNGAYFVTICIKDRECLLGDVIEDAVKLNLYGQIVHDELSQLPQRYTHVDLDTFVIMPNHVHVVVTLFNTPEAHIKRLADLSELMRRFKSFSARRINELREMQGVSVWQRSFYDHVIRNEDDLNRIRAYIEANPANWSKDDYYSTTPK